MFIFAPAARAGTRGYLFAVFLGITGGTLTHQALAAEPQVLAASTSEGAVEGVVADGEGKPLASARIQLINAAGKVVAQAQSDAHGIFSIGGVAAGSYTVTAAKSGNFSSAGVQVSAGVTSRAELALGSKELQSVTVTAKRFERARNQLSPSTGSSQYTFDDKAIQQLPEGDHTAFNQVLLQAPGVANDQQGQLHIRGDHNDIQYRLNGIILPDGTSGFGQVLDPRFAKSITLNTGALPAQYGLRTAGVIDIVTKDQFNGGDVDLYGGSRDTLNPSFQIGKSSSQFTAYLTGQYLTNELGIENPTDSSNALHDRTAQGKGFGYFSYLLNSSTRISAIVAATSSRLEIPDNPGQLVNCEAVNQLNGNNGCDPTAPPASVNVGSSPISSSGLNERQFERNQYGILALQGVGANDLSYQLAAYDRVSTVQFAPDPLGDLVFNADASSIKRKASELGAQGDLSYPLGESHTLSSGFAVTLENIRSDNTSVVFPTDANGDIDGPQQTIVDNNPKNGNALATFYIQDKWEPTRNLIVNYGLRYDHVNAFVEGQQLSPRLGLIDYLTPRTTIHAGYARYFTPPPSELVANSTFTKFENTTLAAPANVPNCTPSPTSACVLNSPVQPERSHYLDAGVLHQVTPSYTVGLDAYYRYARDLIDEGQFGTALIYTPFNYAQGHVYGLELTNAYHYRNVSAYLNFAHSVAQAINNVSAQAIAFPDPVEAAYVSQHYIYLDHNQSLTMSGGVSYVGWGTTYGIEGTYEDGLREGFANTGKLKPNVQVDLSASHSVLVSEDFGKLDLRIAAINVLDRKNEIRDGSGIGVAAPAFGPRAAIYFGIAKPFGI
jgi:hypothetical protein